MIKVGIVGGTGYTGVELLRLLAHHPHVSVEAITSRSEAGVKVCDMYPNLRGHYDTLTFSEPDAKQLGDMDGDFSPLPTVLPTLWLASFWTKAPALSTCRLTSACVMSRYGASGTANLTVRLRYLKKRSMACPRCTAKKSKRRAWWPCQAAIQPLCS